MTVTEVVERFDDAVAALERIATSLEALAAAVAEESGRPVEGKATGRDTQTTLP